MFQLRTLPGAPWSRTEAAGHQWCLRLACAPRPTTAWRMHPWLETTCPRLMERRAIAPPTAASPPAGHQASQRTWGVCVRPPMWSAAGRSLLEPWASSPPSQMSCRLQQPSTKSRGRRSTGRHGAGPIAFAAGGWRRSPRGTSSPSEFHTQSLAFHLYALCCFVRKGTGSDECSRAMLRYLLSRIYCVDVTWTHVSIKVFWSCAGCKGPTVGKSLSFVCLNLFTYLFLKKN